MEPVIFADVESVFVLAVLALPTTLVVCPHLASHHELVHFPSHIQREYLCPNLAASASEGPVDWMTSILELTEDNRSLVCSCSAALFCSGRTDS
ncbi:hypothetical protein WR25_00896 [Diploscapter pachys]|uniref:Uncharacterized protein n=1 Tax=Diploscapter pachys TaxID=2018661 RepID=A0A2A2KW33_9BILA|nr:hypothetical protein WR25_00896 [Diploscapter pachys]